MLSSDPHVGEEELAGGRGMEPHLAEGRRLLEPLHPLLEHEGEHPAVAERGVGSVVELGVEDDGVGVGAVGDEGLVAVEDVLVAVPPCSRPHAAEGVRTRVGLGDRPGTDLLGGEQVERPALPLGGRPLLHDRAAGQSEADPHRGDDPGAVVTELDDRDEGHRRGAAAPPSPAPVDLAPLAVGVGRGRELLREPVAGELVHSEGRVQLPDDVVGRKIAELELVDVRHHLGLDEPPDRIADHQLLLGPFEHRAPPGGPGSGVPLAMRLSEARLQSECEEQAPVRIGRKKEGTPYERWGGEAFFTDLVDRFYDEVTADPLLAHMFPVDMTEAKAHLALFLMQFWGGPTTYSEQRGHPRLRMRHARFVIGTAEADALARPHDRGRPGERHGARRRVGAPRLPHDGGPEPGQHPGLTSPS